MVKIASGLGRSGVHDFVLIRASAVILTLYTLYLVGFIAFTDITYESWQGFFSGVFTKAFTMLALVAMLVHAWIGLWQVLTDYIKCALLRGSLQFVLTSVAFIYVFVGFSVLWGV
ncbi:MULTISPECIES: succinate dehydrogenase, hydrophobic membrane anchor protein [unclassified Motilimonas]|uniref:succinate dehydrogenase, hydrophobic membrane anchor protein n=1 Tax=Motilimonas TaxID=1914248 RepID=UPI001E44B16B|nr:MULTISPECIES: succinate dehydrogenase, hydrophobic membrane anchor protein [unclassified Motilimonas]MCE0557919.1 succinate dehydrogenase, hydrophobic membrane anchor protein [Motilimonas sp. E26]MDO6524707.1 succinate dehydrogenase, hydrophobic membrane anchor protein [Motilimonas sp. 1_MG-2023]